MRSLGRQQVGKWGSGAKEPSGHTVDRQSQSSPLHTKPRPAAVRRVDRRHANVPSLDPCLINKLSPGQVRTSSRLNMVVTQHVADSIGIISVAFPDLRPVGVVSRK